MMNKEFLRYLDLFGTKCSFYTEQKQKLYTPLGGVLSIASISLSILIFIYININSFKREDQSIISTSIKEENHKIKFNEEKIWIPWKISNYINDKLFNYTGILQPVIKYYYKENNTKFKSKNISYKSCNETSMINMPENFLIDSSLDQLNCIDMDDLFMGGKFSSDFFYYVEFSLYICNNEINYDNNSNCISYNFNNIQNLIQIIFSYPIFEFQERDFKTPIKIRYHKNCVLLNENIYKMEKLFLQKIKLYDKLGLFDTATKIYKYWVYSSLNKDLYFIKNNNDSNYKIYSIEIFIESNNIYYYRSYKGILIILSQSLPLITLIHNILKLIAKIFKLSSINRKMTELLFENLSTKPNKFNNYIEDLNLKKIVKNKNSFSNINKSTEDNTIINLTNKDNSNPKKLSNFRSYSLLRKRDNNNSIVIKKPNGSPVINNKIATFPENNLHFRLNSFSWNNLIAYKDLSLRYQEPAFPKKKRFIANKLFPFGYYFCAIFVKNIDITNHRFCMSKKFVKVYTFLSQLFDISSYCILHKEFNIVKNSIFDEQKIKLIEQKTKINVNSQNFFKDMNDCIGRNKFHILGKNYIKRRSVDNKLTRISNFEKKYKK